MLFTAKRRKELATIPGTHPGNDTLSVEINLNVPDGATQDDVSRILTSALCEIAEDFGAHFQTRKAA